MGKYCQVFCVKLINQCLEERLLPTHQIRKEKKSIMTLRLRKQQEESSIFGIESLELKNCHKSEDIQRILKPTVVNYIGNQTQLALKK